MKQRGILLVANWDSNVGYAWWLMESYWIKIAENLHLSNGIHLCYPTISAIPPAIEKAPLSVHEIDFTRTDIVSIKSQYRFIRQHSIDCIYLSDQPTFSFRYLLFRIAGVRTIITHDHTPGVRHPAKGFKRLLKLLRSRTPFATVDAIFTATKFVKDRAIQVTCFPANKTHAIPNGIPISKHPNPRSLQDIFGIPEDRVVMVMTGRANRYKGVSFALHCISRMINEHKVKNVHFLFCGDGPDLEIFRKEASDLGITSYVSLPGRRNDIKQILPSCHFAIHPSSGEVGYSLSILEYMLAGLPVIVPDNPSVREATTDGITGFIYRPNDEISACEAISRLATDETLRKFMGTSAEKEVIKNYNLEGTHAALLSTFKKVYSPAASPEKTIGKN